VAASGWCPEPFACTCPWHVVAALDNAFLFDFQAVGILSG